MVRLIQLHVFDSKRNQIVQCEDEPIHIAAAPGCFIVSTAAGFLNVYKSDSECSFLFKFQTRNKEIWDLQYSQFDDSLMTIENESDESTIRVVRHYVNWREQSTNTAPKRMLVNELVASRSVRFFTVDSSGLAPSMTKADDHRRPKPFPYFNILIATDGAVSLYRVRCILEGSLGSDPLNGPLDASTHEEENDAAFTWVFSIKAQASRIGLCASYLSYSISTEVFVLSFQADQSSMEQHSLTQICKSTVDGVKADVAKPSHHSVILSTTKLSSISEASRRGTGNLSRSNSSTSVDTGSFRLGAPSSSSASLEPGSVRSSSVDLSRPMSARASPSIGVVSKLTSGFTLTDTRDSVQTSQYHHDIIFDKTNSIKNKAPFVELPLDTRNAHVIGAQGNPLGPPMTPTTGGNSQAINQIIGPQHDSNSYIVNTDEDFVLLSAQLLFYRNLALTIASEDADNFLVLSGQIPANELDTVIINSLSLLPIRRTTSPDSTLAGVRVFIGNAVQGHVWLFKNQELCETATYNFLTECSKTIATESFLYSLTNSKTVLIHLMRQFDPIHSGAQYGQMKGETQNAKAPKASTPTKRAPTPPVQEEVQSTSKTLVRQTSDPLLVGALDFFGLCQICANMDGRAMILCKSSDDQIAALRDASLAGRNRSSSQPKNAINFDTNSSQRRFVAQGWNLIATNLNPAMAMLEQFRNWVSNDEELTKDDWSILMELWTLANVVIQSYRRPKNPLQTLNWITEEDYRAAIRVKRSTMGKLAQIEYQNNRLIRAAVMWSLSDVPAHKTIDKLMLRLKKGHQDRGGPLTQDACVELLKRVLLGPTQRMDLIDISIGFADVVYAILILQNAPLVGQVVLESPLDKFDIDNTITLLEKTMKKLEDQVQGASDIVSSFLGSALVLDSEGEVTSKALALDDFYQSQTPAERQLWMTTLALVILMLRRDEQNPESSNLNSSGPTADVFLLKLPEAFLVPYLTMHSHLMFEDSRKPMYSKVNLYQSSYADFPESDTSKPQTPSKFAHLLAQIMPWTCLELLVTAGHSTFPPAFASRLLESNTVEFPWMKDNLAKLVEQRSSPSPLPSKSSNGVSSPQNGDHAHWKQNPILLTSYLEAQVLPFLNPNPKSTTSYSPSSSTSNDLVSASDVELMVENLKLLSSRYIDQIALTSAEISGHLKYFTSDHVMKTNPHNTRPPVSLEGIWKEYHREYLIDSRYKFLESIPPFIPPVKGPRDLQTIPENFYLFKLQGLICALKDKVTSKPGLDSILPTIATHVIEGLKAHVPQVAAEIDASMQILCHPILGGLEGLEATILQIVDHYPTSLTKFFKKYLPFDDMKKWKATMGILLAKVAKHETETTIWCLEETLKYLAQNLSSSDFLSLLPDNGNVAFFIPYIELNLGRNASMKLLTQIQALK